MSDDTLWPGGAIQTAPAPDPAPEPAPPEVGVRVQRTLVFGRDRVPDEVQVARTKGGSARSNPCVIAFGPGPEGRICRDCVNLFAQGGVAGTYYKCALRHLTGGPGSDHRVRWPACARFEERSDG